MYSAPALAFKYLRYFFSAYNGKGHGMHSPFLFSFITDVLNDKKEYPAYKKVEEMRRSLLQDKTPLLIRDFGAGSVTSAGNERTVSSIARSAAKPKKFSQLLHRIARCYNSKNILELGTSLGISTSYLAMAHADAHVVTLEGAETVADYAAGNFRSLGLHNIHVVKGNFDDTLATVLNELPEIDLAFIDGNHRREPTLAYFHQLLPYLHNDSMVIFDDIHWSKGMEQAWQQIGSHEAVRCSIDLFFIGIVFFRKEFKEKQQFAIRF